MAGHRPLEASILVRVQAPQPARKSQTRLAPLAGLGNQIVRNFGLKNQLAVLFE